MTLALVGVSHRTAPIEARERFYVLASQLGEVLGRLRAEPGVEECVILSTCNRTEYYLHAAAPGIAERVALEAMTGVAGIPPATARPYLYHREGRDSVVHLFRVTCGLDSLVLGEHEIQGQVRDAYALAGERAPGSVGPVLHRLFQAALAVGGRVRSRTGIGEGTASVPAAATRLAEKVLGSLEGRVAIVLGAGAMGKLTLACLLREGVTGAGVASRSLERAERVARPVGARAIPLDEFWRELGRADIVVTSTGSPRPVLTADRLRAARVGREHPLVVLDIALPRDVEPEAGDIPGVFLYNIDDLQRVVDTTEERRADDRETAAALIEAHAEAYWGWYRAREAAPIIRRFRDEAESLRREEVERALAGLADLADEDRERIHRATRQLLARLLHGPTVALRRLAGGPYGAEALDVARRLFQLDGGEEHESG